ncbi:LmbU family transcriptional regulator [Pseudonocardia sp. ICBG1122]|nr:hypothetical protein WY02_00135 [Pseudonocardia sp. AL041005-10]NWJ72098.1 LmbU family transcriptional regulator [Pseudonocardia pini]
MRFSDGVDFDAWSRAGCQLSGVLDSSAWWLGDWLVFGKKHFADRYQRGIEKAGLSYQTLRNYAWVARRFALERRRPGLTFQHHAEVASLPEEAQDQLLRHAEDEGWTTKQLRAELDEVRRGKAKAAGPGRSSRVAVPTASMRRWSIAAKIGGQDLESWMLLVLDRAAEEALNRDTDRRS